MDASPSHQAGARSTFGEILDEALPLIGAVPIYGPPVVVVAAPWLLLTLVLAGPFAVLVTFAVLLVAVAALVGLIGAILAAPFLLVRSLRGHWPRRAPVRSPAPPLLASGSR